MVVDGISQIRNENTDLRKKSLKKVKESDIQKQSKKFLEVFQPHSRNDPNVEDNSPTQKASLSPE